MYDNGRIYRTDPIATQLDHGNFAWGNALDMDDGLEEQVQTNMRPTTIGFSDRHHGFIGGSVSLRATTPCRSELLC